MIIFNAMQFLKLKNQLAITSKFLGDFSLAHGFRFFIKPSFVAQLRVFLWKSAIHGNDFSYPEFIESVPDRIFGAVNFPRYLFGRFPLFNQLRSEPFGIINLAPVSIWRSLVTSNVGLVENNHKVLGTIVEWFSVDVVNFFMRQKKAVKLFFHYEAMLKNVTTFIGKGVVGYFYGLVAVHKSVTTSPFPVSFATIWNNRKTALSLHTMHLPMLQY